MEGEGMSIAQRYYKATVARRAAVLNLMGLGAWGKCVPLLTNCIGMQS